MAMTLRKGVGRESMINHPFGLQDSWILIADYCASNCGNWIKSSLDDLSKKQAKQLSKNLHPLKGLPWKIDLLVESTIHHRASLHPENAKTFHHGNGYVIGHQWTNIVLMSNDLLIPLPPIPFDSQTYCRAQGLDYQREHEAVIDDLTTLHLEDYIGASNSRRPVKASIHQAFPLVFS